MSGMSDVIPDRDVLSRRDGEASSKSWKSSWEGGPFLILISLTNY